MLLFKNTDWWVINADHISNKMTEIIEVYQKKKILVSQHFFAFLSLFPSLPHFFWLFLLCLITVKREKKKQKKVVSLSSFRFHASNLKKKTLWEKKREKIVLLYLSITTKLTTIATNSTKNSNIMFEKKYKICKLQKKKSK